MARDGDAKRTVDRRRAFTRSLDPRHVSFSYRSSATDDVCFGRIGLRPFLPHFLAALGTDGVPPFGQEWVEISVQQHRGFRREEEREGVRS